MAVTSSFESDPNASSSDFESSGIERRVFRDDDAFATLAGDAESLRLGKENLRGEPRPRPLPPEPGDRLVPVKLPFKSGESRSAIASSTRAWSDLRNASSTRSELRRDRESRDAYVASAAERGRRRRAAAVAASPRAELEPGLSGSLRSLPPFLRVSSRSSSSPIGPSARARLSSPSRSRTIRWRPNRSRFRASHLLHISSSSSLVSG